MVGRALWRPLHYQLMVQRVEKYRPNTLDDVSGHQDILATINKFVETNVLLASIAIRRCTVQH